MQIKRIKMLAALASVAVAGVPSASVLAQQEDGELPIKSTEPSTQPYASERVMVRADPVPVPPDNPRMQEMRDFYLKECSAEGPTATVRTLNQTATIRFVDDVEGYAAIGLCFDEYHLGVVRVIGTVKDALVFLAWKPVSALWPTAEHKWGSDLSKLRVQIRTDQDRIRASNNTYSRMLNSSTSRAINNGRKLSAIGYPVETKAILDKRIEWITNPDKKRAKSRSYDLALLGISYGGFVLNTDGEAAAASYIESYLSNIPLDEDEHVNLQINQAAYLAESGDYEKALSVLTPAWKAFRAVNQRGSLYQISGSDREFSWIFACIHHQLGSPERAKPFIATVESAEEQPSDPYLSRVKRSVVIKLRMYQCMDDADGFFNVWETSKPAFFDQVWLEFQTGSKGVRNTGVHRDWVLEDSRASDLSSDYRQLPEALQPALRRWQRDDVEPSE